MLICGAALFFRHCYMPIRIFEQDNLSASLLLSIVINAILTHLFLSFLIFLMINGRNNQVSIVNKDTYGYIVR